MFVAFQSGVTIGSVCDQRAAPGAQGQARWRLPGEQGAFGRHLYIAP